MSNSNDITAALSFLYFTAEEEKEFQQYRSIIDKWRSFFYYNWHQIVAPQEYRFYESLVLVLDYQQLLDYNVPPTIEQFKKDIYSKPSFTLACMSMALHIETINKQHSTHDYGHYTDFLRSEKSTKYYLGDSITISNASTDASTISVTSQWNTEICACHLQDTLDHVLQRGNLWRYLFLNEAKNCRIRLAVENFGPVLPYNALRSHNVNCLVCIQGQVIRIGIKKPMVISALFSCVKCSKTFFKKFNDGRFEFPSKCCDLMCNSKIFNLHRHFVDVMGIQRIRLQREDIAEYHQDKNTKLDTASNDFVDVELTGTLVDSCKPGNMVQVVGIVKAAPTAYDDDTNGQKSTFNIYIHATSLKLSGSKNSGVNTDGAATGNVSNGSDRLMDNILTNYLCNDAYAKISSNGVNRLMTTNNSDSTLGYHGFSCDESQSLDQPMTIDDVIKIHNGLETRTYDFIRDIYYNEPNRFYLVTASLCPKVIGRNYIKAGLMLALLGGVAAYRDDKQLKRRGNIHCLLVGDPGVGKSLLLRSISSLVTGAMFFCGGSITSSGLTAAVVREKGSSEYCLEAGALVLSAGGICCIDELDKTSLAQHHAFLEAMEQQSVSLAKGGIICTLNAQCTVLCAANPVCGKYNFKRSLYKNINLPPALISRFDLLFVIVDNVHENVDDKITSRILNSRSIYDSSSCSSSVSSQFSIGSQGLNDEYHYSHATVAAKITYFRNDELLSEDLLKSYIEYAKTFIQPKFSRESKAYLQSFYCDLRNLSKQYADSLPITTRQLEGIIRLCQARARGDLSEEITVDHIKDVIEIFKNTAHYPGFLDSTNTGEYKPRESKLKSTNAAIAALVERLRQTVAVTGTTKIANQDIVEMATGVLNKYPGIMQPADLIQRVNHFGYILKQGTYWRANL